MTPSSMRTAFTGSLGQELAARLDLAPGPVRAYALFAHCFTCSKDSLAARHIAGKLAGLGIGVLRFDFTGLGASEGEFANTSFSSNVEDLVRAADHLRTHFAAPALLIGHSLGGAAVLAAAHHVPEATAVVTIAAPSDVAHVLQHFHADLAQIERDGVASVTLAGRTFQIRKEFIEDAKAQAVKDRIASLRKALLVMHAATDQIVGIEHATAIFTAARHPKSFVSLDTADHLLTNRRDAAYAAEVIAAWASRFLPEGRAEAAAPYDGVVVAETGAGKFQNSVTAGRHRLLADGPTSAGGLGSGPSPYDYLAIERRRRRRSGARRQACRDRRQVPGASYAGGRGGGRDRRFREPRGHTMTLGEALDRQIEARFQGAVAELLDPHPSTGDSRLCRPKARTRSSASDGRGRHRAWRPPDTPKHQTKSSGVSSGSISTVRSVQQDRHPRDHQGRRRRGDPHELQRRCDGPARA